jgi:hypothetical protein
VIARQVAVKVLPAPVKRSILRNQRRYLRTVVKYRQLTNQIGPLPHYLVIGGQRCGSTYIHDRLCEHPNIVPPLTKEINFFSIAYRRGEDWYRGFFSKEAEDDPGRTNGNRMITGEASGYVFHPLAPPRIAKHLPDAKLILLLRNPVKRAYSHYQHMRRVGQEDVETFEEAIALEPERMRGETEREINDDPYFSYHRHHHSYLTRGIYADQLEWWFDAIPRERFMIFASEEFYSDLATVLRKVTDFLELPDWTPAVHKPPKQFGYEPLKDETRRELEEYFRPHNERLYEMLGVDLGWNK